MKSIQTARAATKTHWFLEPGHTAAEFQVRHMMVSWVRGCFKNVGGKLEFDPHDLSKTKIDIEIPAKDLWTGEPDRDAHLLSADFLDVERFPIIEFHSKRIERLGSFHFKAIGDLAIRGVTKQIQLDVQYLGAWETGWWEDGVDKGPRMRAGFVATATINRLDFGVNWNSDLVGGGVVVGNDVYLTIDAEAIRSN